MNREQAATGNLRERSDRLIASVLKHFVNLVKLTTEPIDGASASVGQAMSNKMAIDMETTALIQSVEELLQLTRLIRELIIIGPLRKPGEGEKEAEERSAKEVQNVVGLLNKIRTQVREGLVKESLGQSEFGQGAYNALVDGNKAEASSQVGPR
ncbi:hypothetical protein DL546_006236 [Coniochaeta pulveracea]|uniref:Uncharacterized protein n=1 Tax=Coniochaeta pulveracea TaxID=177199 RepID=A0A420YIV8_9PEZI|nr:hypothetical protein DL546_006236 [Coniochaeta pulveracea]